MEQSGVREGPKELKGNSGGGPKAEELAVIGRGGGRGSLGGILRNTGDLELGETKEMELCRTSTDRRSFHFLKKFRG